MVWSHIGSMVARPSVRVHIILRGSRHQRMEEVRQLYSISSQDFEELSNAPRDKAFTKKGAVT
jgi:hypothetical protein